MIEGYEDEIIDTITRVKETRAIIAAVMACPESEWKITDYFSATRVELTKLLEKRLEDYEAKARTLGCHGPPAKQDSQQVAGIVHGNNSRSNT